MLRLFERRTSPGPVAHIDVAHAGEAFRVALKRVATSQRFTLQGARREPRRAVDHARAQARCAPRANSPNGTPPGSARGSRGCRSPVAFAAAAVTPLRGVDHTIVHRPGERGVVWTETGPAGPIICVAGEKPFIARRVVDFLKREARKDLEAAVARHSKRLGVAPRRIALRDTASRWGSCSSTGGLNFSWRLILAPPEILDYLAAHEVAHIVHMNHSPMFWKVTRRLFPDTERAEAWLRVNGADLHRFGAEGD